MALSHGDHDDAVALLEEGVILSEQIQPIAMALTHMLITDTRLATTML